MDDNKIIVLLNDRDESVITVLLRKYGNYCLAISSNILSDPMDQEECLNDALLAVWNSIPPNQPNNLKGYIGRLTRNIAINKYRSQNAQKRRGEEVDIAFEELETAIPSNIDLEDVVIQNETILMINDFLRKIPKRECSIFVQRYYFLRSSEQIGLDYGISAGHVRMILTRIRKKLKTYLEKRGGCYE